MKAILLTTLLCTSVLTIAAPASASCPILDEATIHCTQPNPCIRTDATCGPFKDAWAYIEVDYDYVQVCVTSNIQHLLC